MLVRKILSSHGLFWLIPVILVLPFILRINTDSYYMIATGKYITRDTGNQSISCYGWNGYRHSELALLRTALLLQSRHWLDRSAAA